MFSANLSAESSNYTGIHPWIKSGEKLEAEVFLDGKNAAHIEYVAEHDGMHRKPAVTFNVPANLKQLRLSGKFTTAQRKSNSFDVTWKVHDMARYTTPLYDTKLVFHERIKKFADLLKNEEEKSKGKFLSPVSLKNTEGDYKKALDTLETRLKVRLPQEVHALSRYEVEIKDWGYFKPSRLGTVMEALDEYSRRVDLKYTLSPRSPCTRARYERSILVFVEDGSEGLGGLAWDPQGVTEGESSNIAVDKHSLGAKRNEPNTGIWYWWHEVDLDEPQLLLDRNFQPRNAEEALLNAFQRFAVDSVEELFGYIDIKKGPLLVDSAHPRGFLQLSFDENGKNPTLWLRSYGYHDYSML